MRSAGRLLPCKPVPGRAAFIEAVIADKVHLPFHKRCIRGEYNRTIPDQVPAMLRRLIVLHIGIGRHPVNGNEVFPDVGGSIAADLVEYGFI